MQNKNDHFKKRMDQLKNADNKRNIVGRSKKISKSSVIRNGAMAVTVTSHSNILITGGLGDFFAIESFFSKSLKNSLQTICYATSKYQLIQNCLKCLPNYKIEKHIVVWSDFSKFWCFYNKKEIEVKLQNRINHELHLSQDFSISLIFNLIRNGVMKFNSCSFVENNLVPIENFTLPEKYITVCPYSSDKRIVERDFDKDDWINLVKYAEKENIKMVILNDKKENVPNHDLIVDISGQTSPVQAIEILKNGNGYIGIDSSLSVIAAKKFSSKSISIKSKNDHCYNWKDVYYAPLREFSFLQRFINYDRIKVFER